MPIFARPSRSAACAAGVGGLVVLILAGRLASTTDDILFVAVMVWLFAWSAVRFALDLNGIADAPVDRRLRRANAQYSLGELWLDRT